MIQNPTVSGTGQITSKLHISEYMPYADKVTINGADYDPGTTLTIEVGSFVNASYKGEFVQLTVAEEGATGILVPYIMGRTTRAVMPEQEFYFVMPNQDTYIGV